MNKRRSRTKREQNCTIRTKREHPRSVTNLSLLLIHHCCNSVTVLHLGNSVTIVSQCCRIATNILKVCVCVPIEHSLALILQGMRLTNRCIYRYAFGAYGPKTLYGGH